MNKLIGLGQLVELFIASEKANKAYYACDISDIDTMCAELHNANHAFSVYFEHFKKVNDLSNKQACALLHSTVEKEALKNAINSKVDKMQVFISRKKQNVGASIDFKNAFHLDAILVCSDKHEIMINQAVTNNTKANLHYETKKRLYVHYVDNAKIVKITSHV